MKILMTADAVTDVWTYAMELAAALEPMGVDIVLAVMGPAPDVHQLRQAKRRRNLLLHCRPYKLEWMPDPWNDVREAGRWLLEMEREHRPDVIHLNGPAHGVLPWRAPVIAVAHSCILCWWEAVKGEPAPPAWNRYRYEIARGLADVDRVIASSAARLAAVRKHYGPLPSARLIPHGREAPSGMTAIKEPLIFATGCTEDEADNIAALQSVAPDLPWPIRIAGGRRKPADALSPRLSRSNGSSRLSSKDHFTVLQCLCPDQMAGWFSRAAIYARPAKYEPFGLCPLDAALARCALVLGDIPALRELWSDAAIFINPHDPDVLRNAIQWLINHPSQRSALGRRAYHRALLYGPRPMAQTYLTEYRQLIPRRQGLETPARAIFPTPAAPL